MTAALCSSCSTPCTVLVVLRGPRGSEYQLCRQCFCPGPATVKKGKR